MLSFLNTLSGFAHLWRSVAGVCYRDGERRFDSCARHAGSTRREERPHANRAAMADLHLAAVSRRARHQSAAAPEAHEGHVHLRPQNRVSLPFVYFLSFINFSISFGEIIITHLKKCYRWIHADTWQRVKKSMEERLRQVFDGAVKLLCPDAFIHVSPYMIHVIYIYT